jgi:hypothetical protein
MKFSATERIGSHDFKNSESCQDRLRLLLGSLGELDDDGEELETR